MGGDQRRRGGTFAREMTSAWSVLSSTGSDCGQLRPGQVENMVEGGKGGGRERWRERWREGRVWVEGGKGGGREGWREVGRR